MGIHFLANITGHRNRSKNDIGKTLYKGQIVYERRYKIINVSLNAISCQEDHVCVGVVVRTGIGKAPSVALLSSL